jgi:hypothetical protein
VIVVVGSLAWREGDPPGPGGRACEIALAAAAGGARVELVGRAGDDPTGDELLLALAREGVGHVAVLRDAARPTPVLPPRPSATDDDPARPLDAGLVDGSEEATEADRGPATGRDGPALDAADVSLGLQYLTAFGVLVVTDDVPEGAIPVAVDAAGFAGAHLVLLVADGDNAPTAGVAPPADATVLAAPADDDGSFARLVGAYAAGLDAGAEPARSFAAAVAAVGGEAVEPSA